MKGNQIRITLKPSVPLVAARKAGEEFAADLNRLLPDAETAGCLGLPVSAGIVPIAGCVDAGGGDDVEPLIAGHGKAGPSFEAHVVKAPIPWVECEDDHLEMGLREYVVESDELRTLGGAEVEEGDAEVREGRDVLEGDVVGEADVEEAEVGELAEEGAPLCGAGEGGPALGV